MRGIGLRVWRMGDVRLEKRRQAITEARKLDCGEVSVCVKFVSELACVVAAAGHRLNRNPGGYQLVIRPIVGATLNKVNKNDAGKNTTRLERWADCA